MTIHVRNWDRFQHRDVARGKQRVPQWIRVYTELMSGAEFRDLTFHQRGVLISIWLEYARGRRQLSDNTATLTRQLGHRVTTRDLAALNHAGYIEFLPATCKQDAGLEEKREDKRLEKKATSTRVDVTQPDELAARRRRGLTVNDQPVTSLADYLADQAGTNT